MKRLFIGSCPKDSGSPEANEDKYAFSSDGNRLALCDGASESFDSKVWADLLARHFVEDPKVNQDWVALALLEYNEKHDFDSMSWSKQAAFERGSFATLLGLEYFQAHQAVEVLAVGDSIAILCDNEQLTRSWSISDPEQFKQHPTLLSTLSAHNRFVEESGFWSDHGRTFSLTGLNRPVILCMTDALGEWALRQAQSGGSGLARLIAMESEEELIELVLQERSAKRMKIDDSTLVVVSFDTKKAIDGIPIS